MYIVDRDINGLLDEMGIEGPNPAHPFEPGSQVQPCSIDLRVSEVFWRPRRRRTLWRRLTPWRDRVIDLRRSSIHDLSPLRDWKRFEVKEGQTVTIKPGETIMARIYERFKMPRAYAGKVEGRSSFARMGLSVHCTGDFINPGWEGYMPLQLTNHGPYPIRLAPFFPICQLMLVRLSGEPERAYGDEGLSSKYDNDDGGPSLWWRDATVKQLQDRLGHASAHEAIRQEIVARIGSQSTEVISRLESDIDRRRGGQIENADEVLEWFSRREKLRRLRDNALLTLPVVFVGAGLASLLGPVVLLLVFAVAFVCSLIPATLAFERRDDGYAISAELGEVRPDE
jgi:deoxycytidine triphosphate deaminase